MNQFIHQPITYSITQLFNQLNDMMQQLSAAEYQQPIPVLSGASIGQHMRHVIELFIELNNGYTAGQVNYENRKRDLELEHHKEVAAEQLKQILDQLDKPDRPMVMQSIVNADFDELTVSHTSYARELLYNIEHTIHHMALIKIGVQQISTISLPRQFGLAAATIKYREQCAQ